ncbi:DUF305 domain-containing protein [Arenimonas donghaensis]|uniref:DUF305 domain-containing protein n=1 Tax=Arenimonas donghaensis DSM 18148 = HO3-R19 TaxID=1121014 RepID=A0A087MM21_9GAMM|nr:DUF305 domain-containing protein [Arenimonas donghaensis]KFL37924.1 hypothetical protein N788_01765 [Arenimonas donghaensis DSM 18148 = HO3-R19]
MTPLNPYLRFALMLLTSGLVMYGLMYLHTYELAHVFYSQTRLWMTLIMVAGMAVVMLAFMQGMYRNPRANVVVVLLAALGFAGSLWLVRSQQTVDDVSYMKAMIPHHSIAILTSKRAQIRDPRVRQLADDIIAAQEREITEMKALIEALESRE